jgi:hypothetical protein
LVFIFLFLGKKFERETPLSVWEKLVFWGDVGIAALFGANIFSASFAAVALQLDDTLTYLPTIKDTARKASCEHPRPWVFWTIGYALQGWVVAAAGGGWIEWSYPLINLPLCLIVAVLASRRSAQCPV